MDRLIIAIASLVLLVCPGCKSSRKATRRTQINEQSLPGIPREVSFFVEDTMSVRRSGRTQFASFAISIREQQPLAFSVGACDWAARAYVPKQIFQIPPTPEHFAKFIAATQLPRGPIPLIVAYQGHALPSLKASINSPLAAQVLPALEEALAREGIAYEIIWEENLSISSLF